LTINWTTYNPERYGINVGLLAVGKSRPAAHPSGFEMIDQKNESVIKFSL